MAAVFHKAVSKDLLHDVALRNDAGEAHKEVSEANSERRRCDLGRGQADLRHDGKANRDLDGDDANGPRGLKTGLERCVARLAHLLICAAEDIRDQDDLGDKGRSGPHKQFQRTGGDTERGEQSHEHQRLHRIPADGVLDVLGDDHHGGRDDQKAAKDVDDRISHVVLPPNRSSWPKAGR